ncbi:protein translocase subunit SecF [Candidatus Pantoea edessiphila]|uniref:Protein-export membrane protein SecF n=1 Tax=Candidatus Pantoea edessiphila TaxID=2044610 RepID=A0A2P5SVI2_9GAMM|nr:protein translocase subunit SecF [Candidatus Pantoea edessiphila]PPI86344.1 protein translocase subunit SecF [Candidatus Pantoea edessiphila]
MSQISYINEFNEKNKIFDFMRWNKLAFFILGLLIIFSFVFIFMIKFNWGVDFTGGTVIEINLETAVDLNLIRSTLIQSGFNKPIVSTAGSKSIMIKIHSYFNSKNSDDLSSKLINAINKNIKQKIIINHIDFVGPSVGIDLIKNGVIALLCAIASVLLYVGFRFDWYLAFGIVVALFSDLIITCGFLSLFHIEIDLTILASLMSVIGYSLNDKIVISDRIRENTRHIKSFSYYEIINISLNQVLKRTLITSLITSIMVIILLLFGGSLLTGFSLTMLIGLIFGTLSSIYVFLSLALIAHSINNRVFLYQ